MTLCDRLQTLEPQGETVREIPKQRVDELLQIFALVGSPRGVNYFFLDRDFYLSPISSHCNEVVGNPVVGPRMELRFLGRNTLPRPRLSRVVQRTMRGHGLDMAALYSRVHGGRNVTHATPSKVHPRVTHFH